MANSVRDIDRGYKKFRRNLSGPGATALVGVQGQKADDSHTDSEMSVGEIASIHELGLGVPERSWLRAWVDENETQIQDDLRAAMRQVILGKFTKDQAISILAIKYVGEMQARIAAGIEPPNAPSTIARKESSTPLIDTGQLRSAITWVLENAVASGGGPVTL